MSMGIAEVQAVAASLAMDAFSISICAGLAAPGLKFRRGLILGAVFGFFQFLMPLLGAAVADRLSEAINSWAPWIASGLIVFVALKMIVETYKNDSSCPPFDVNARDMLVIGLATSLDALAVGFSIKSTGGPALQLALSAGIITFVLSLLGSLGGGLLGERVGSRAQYLGGAVLLLVAANIAFG